MNRYTLLLIVISITTQTALNAAQITIQNDPHRTGPFTPNICFKSSSGENCLPMPPAGKTVTYTVPDDTYECTIEAGGSSPLLTWSCKPNKTYIMNKQWNGRVWVYKSVTEQ